METVLSPVNTDDRKGLGIKPGDTVRVWQKIQEKGKTRLQAFEGLVLARKHGNEAGATFTVRRIADGVGVEKIFPLYSPMIDKIEIIRRAKMRRAKLYYIREKVAREIKRQMRNMRMMYASTGAIAEPSVAESKKEDTGGDVEESTQEENATDVTTPAEATEAKSTDEEKEKVA
jgi:large subunit ribosomal protein L19